MESEQNPARSLPDVGWIRWVDGRERTKTCSSHSGEWGLILQTHAVSRSAEQEGATLTVTFQSRAAFYSLTHHFTGNAASNIHGSPVIQ